MYNIVHSFSFDRRISFLNERTQETQNVQIYPLKSVVPAYAHPSDQAEVRMRARDAQNYTSAARAPRGDVSVWKRYFPFALLGPALECEARSSCRTQCVYHRTVQVQFHRRYQKLACMSEEDLQVILLLSRRKKRNRVVLRDEDVVP